MAAPAPVRIRQPPKDQRRKARADFVNRHTPDFTATMQDFQRVSRGVLFLCITLGETGHKQEAKKMAQRINRKAAILLPVAG